VKVTLHFKKEHSHTWSPDAKGVPPNMKRRIQRTIQDLAGGAGEGLKKRAPGGEKGRGKETRLPCTVKAGNGKTNWGRLASCAKVSHTGAEREWISATGRSENSQEKKGKSSRNESHAGRVRKFGDARLRRQRADEGGKVSAKGPECDPRSGRNSSIKMVGREFQKGKGATSEGRGVERGKNDFSGLTSGKGGLAENLRRGRECELVLGQKKLLRSDGRKGKAKTNTENRERNRLAGPLRPDGKVCSSETSPKRKVRRKKSTLQIRRVMIRNGKILRGGGRRGRNR